MRVLITGGAGRLGIMVCRTFLDHGFDVAVFDLDTPGNRKTVTELGGEADIFWGDITNPDSLGRALDGADAVVHMAGVLPPVSDQRPDLAEKVNVGGTQVLVDLLKERDGRIPFVFTSSVAVFGPTPAYSGPLDSDRDEPRPADVYGDTKLRAERLINESGIDYVVLRLTATLYFVLGVSDLKRLYSIPLENRIEFCHPHDAALAMVNAVKKFDAVKGNTLVVAGGPRQRMLYRDMVGAMLGVMGLPLPPRKKFVTEPAFLDWYNTEKSQKLLKFQKRGFSDYLQGYKTVISRQYTVLFVPLMYHVIGPLFGKLISRLF